MVKLRTLYLALILDERVIALRRVLAELGRQLTLRKRIVHVFLQVDDPYSYLLSHYLDRVMQRYQRVEFHFYLCQALRGEFTPQPALQTEYALADCRMLAAELGVPFLDRGAAPAAEHRRALLDFLADEQGEEDFAATFSQALSAYWRGDAEAVVRLMGPARTGQSATNVVVGRNQLLLRKMGHYNCATMYYAGEWYWGVDRLYYLIGRFNDQGLDRYREATPELAALGQAMQVTLPARRPARAGDLPPLEVYYSFRSPYAYLALGRVFDLADAYGLQLVVRPVLPMVMRGLSVPRQKLLYIVRDAGREASHLGVPFGKIAAPTGAGAERCIAAFYYAEAQGRARRFLAAAGDAIWARGIDPATDAGMQVVAERSGLEWTEVRKALADDGWRAAAESNREALTELGLWGVPCFRIGDLALWGQDRLWLLARRIEEMCHDNPDMVA